MQMIRSELEEPDLAAIWLYHAAIFASHSVSQSATLCWYCMRGTDQAMSMCRNAKPRTLAYKHCPKHVLKIIYTALHMCSHV